MNRKLTAMNKLLMEENDRLQKQVSQLVYENTYFRQHTQNVKAFNLHAVYHVFVYPPFDVFETWCKKIKSKSQVLY